MLRFKYKLKIHLLRRCGLLAHIVPLREPQLTPVVNAVRVAYFKRCCGGLGRPQPRDAVVEPIRECTCMPADQDEAFRMRTLGCGVSQFVVRLQTDGAVVFDQTLPMQRLAPIAHALYITSGMARRTDKDEEVPYLWRLTADFLTPAPQMRNDGSARHPDDEAVVLEDAEQLVRPVHRQRPHQGPAGEAPVGDLPIYVRREALDNPLRHANETQDALEVGGALLGQVARDEGGLFVVVEDAPLLATDGTANAVSFGWEAFRQVRERINRETGQILLGLWHVHPPSCQEVFASLQDVWGFQMFWPEPWNIFAVVGRTLAMTSFFGWSEDGTVGSLAYHVIDG